MDRASIRSLRVGMSWVAPAALLMVVSVTAAAQQPRTARATHGHAFVENLGQWPSHIAFASRTNSGHVTASREGIGLHAVVERGDEVVASGVFLRFEGADLDNGVNAQLELDGVYSYFRGNDPAQWVRGARSFAGVRWPEVHPGVDVVLRSEGGALEYDLILAPRADLPRLVLRCEGATGARVTESGDLVLETPLGELRQQLGQTWQDAGGAREKLLARFVVLGQDRFGFEVPAWDRALALTIDPGLEWSTYLGSAQPGTNDLGYGVAAGPGGTVTLVGVTGWIDFPNTPTSYQNSHPRNTVGDWFVTRLDSASGAIIFSSLIGSYSDDRAFAVGVDTAGRTVVTGTARGEDFPTTTGAFQTFPIPMDGSRGIVLRLSPMGTDLEYSTYIQGTSNEGIHAYDDFFPSAVVIDESTGAVIVVGTGDGLLPTTPGAFDPVGDGVFWPSGYIARIDPTGSFLEWATFLGGTRADYIYAVALDSECRVAVTGRTDSRDFPITPGVFQPEYSSLPPTMGAPSLMSFLTVFEPSGSSLAHSTYFGAQGHIDFTNARALAAHPDGGWVMAGGTGSSSGEGAIAFFTTPGAYQENPGGEGDGFVVRFDEALTYPRFSTFLGGPGAEHIRAIAIDHSGVLSLSGNCFSGFPTTAGAAQLTNAGITDAFAARLSPDGSRLLYSSVLGGGDYDMGEAITVQPDGVTTVVGTTLSYDYPTTANALYPDYQGGQSEVFATTLDMMPTGVAPFGRSTPSCLGPVQLGVLSEPRAGAGDFGFYVSQAAPSSHGWLALGVRGGMHLLGGAQFLLDPTHRLLRRGFVTDSDGFAVIPLALSGVGIGTRLDAQVLVRRTAACPGAARLASSNGLRVDVH